MGWGRERAPSGPLTEVERYRFDLDGYVVRRGALDADTVRRLRAAVDGLGVPAPGTSIQSQRFRGLLEAGGLIRDLMDHAAVLDIVRELCGPAVRLDHAYGIVMAPGTGGLGLHGGAVPFDPAQYYEVRDGRVHTGLVAVLWALVDHPAGAGGFACVPGSHRAGFALPRGVDLDHEMVREVSLSAGDVVVFTEALTHGTLPWRSDGVRWALLYKYSPGSSSWELGPPCGAGTLEVMSERQRLLCQPPSVAHHRTV